MSSCIYLLINRLWERRGADDLTTVDCENILRGGVVRPGEYEKGSWRYRVETNRMAIVIAFRSSEELVVITAWRIKA